MSDVRIRRLEVGQMKSNCYLVIDQKTNACLIIDPGDDVDYIERNIVDLSTYPVAIVATHGHFDHVMGAHELKLAYNVPFGINPKDKFLLTRLRRSVKYYLKADTLPAPSIDLQLVDRYRFDDFGLVVISTPGHTPGSVCLYNRQQKILFCGDLMFSDGYFGRTDFEYANEVQLKKSINLIKKLPRKTIIYPGHGNEFLL